MLECMLLQPSYKQLSAIAAHRGQPLRPILNALNLRDQANNPYANCDTTVHRPK